MYSQSYKLTIRDINFANHMDHLAVLNYVHETRVRFFKQFGRHELDVDGNGTGLVVMELNCKYKKECFYADEIRVELLLIASSPTRLAFEHKIYRNGDELAAEVIIRVAFINQARKITPIPEYLVKLAAEQE